MATKSSLSPFVNTRWSVGENVRLSVSHWGTQGGEVHAVALLRKRASGWAVDSETAVEFYGKDAGYRSTDFAAKLVATVLGECPARFFRDNAL